MYHSASLPCRATPFNIASYSMLTHLLAAHCGLQAKELIHHIGDCHIYENHCAPLQDQAKRQPCAPPTLRICEKREDIKDYVESDFVLEGYTPMPVVRMPMSA